MKSIGWVLGIIASLALGQGSSTNAPDADSKDIPPTGHMVTYVTNRGKALNADEMRSRIKLGVPIHIEYAGIGRARHVERVVLDED